MIRIGSKVEVLDNSGASLVSVLNMKRKKSYKSAALYPSELFLGVVKKIAFRGGKLRRHKFVSLVLIATRKKIGRGNGVYVNYDRNVGLPLKFGFFVSAISQEVESRVMYEVCRLKEYKGVLRHIKRFF
jgi:ribosomal protein L14